MQDAPTKRMIIANLHPLSLCARSHKSSYKHWCSKFYHDSVHEEYGVHSGSVPFSTMADSEIEEWIGKTFFRVIAVSFQITPYLVQGGHVIGGTGPMSLQSTSGTSYGYGSWSTVYPPNHSLPAPPNMENSQNGELWPFKFRGSSQKEQPFPMRPEMGGNFNKFYRK